MSRIKYERGISYDTERHVYYLYMDLGKDEDGQRRCSAGAGTFILTSLEK